MSGLTITTLAQQIEDLIVKSEQQTNAVSAWLGGSATGGPNNDGRYPFVDLSGQEILVPSPASFNDMTSGPAAQAAAAKVAAELARDLANEHANRADAQRILSEAARGAAVEARNLSQQHRDHAGTSESNARYWAELAQGAGQSTSSDRVVVEDLAEQVADNAALASQKATAAAASAAQAATFDPTLYDKKSDTLSATRLVGTLDPARLPSTVFQAPIVASSTIASLTTSQQNEVRIGSTIVTSDGVFWSYLGGDKTSESSYRAMADTTPPWSAIANKPSYFPSTIVNVSGLQPALDGKSNVGHSHPISDITNLQGILNDKLSLSAGANTLAGALYVTSRLNINGGDPYLGSEGPTKSIVIAGGGGWTSTGSTIALYGVNHPSQAGNMMIQGGETGTRALTVTGWNSVYFNVRPSFNGGTPWDTNNFNPANKADASAWANPSATAIIDSNGQKSFASGSTGGTIAGQAGVAALELRGGGNGSGAAFFQMHRPGIYATNLGLDTDNRLKIGGWSYGAASDHIWHSGNIPNDKWQTSVDGQNRFYFATDGTTYFGAYNNASWRFRNNATGGDAFTVSVAGAANLASTLVAQGGIYTNGNEVSIRGSSPTLYLRDTDNRSGMIHMNSNTMHFLRGAGNDTSAWETVNGRWPLTINFESNDATFGGSVDVRTHVYAGNNVYAGNEVYAGNWFRVQAACGIYWEQYGGGWHMSDGTYLRVYNSKYLYSAGAAGFDGNVNMGSFAVLSDARLKTDIRPLTGHGHLIDQLTVKTYTKGGKTEWGVIAQEVEKVEPMLVIRAGDPNGEWGDEPLRTVDSNSLMFAILAEVKDLRARVADLDGRS